MLNWASKAELHARVPLGKLLDRAATFSSGSKLFVRGLSYNSNEVALKDAFSQHGNVIQVKVICHPVTGRSKGYVLVKFSSETEAAAALERMSDEVLDGKKIRVDYANSEQSAAAAAADETSSHTQGKDKPPDSHLSSCIRIF
ncbi:glycine-rich RNA-binding protein 2, mitochondrial isoform X1 [Triticum aestivum]|nr:glycine-rich RNA-binding protein 2, mitochondrial-like isoform X1 [Triticum aestivum]